MPGHTRFGQQRKQKAFVTTDAASAFVTVKCVTADAQRSDAKSG